MSLKIYPAYFQQLAHYEWVELAVSLQDVKAPKLSKKSRFSARKAHAGARAYATCI